MKIYPIVEGHGEVEAFPVLLRRIFAEAQCWHIGVGRPIRRTQSQFRNPNEIQKAVLLARLQPECAGIMMMFDGEDGCPAELAASTRECALGVAADIPFGVVVAYREYETWFLAAIESLRGKHGISMDAISPENPESKRGAKEALENFMPKKSAYSETQDQAGMSAVFNLGLAYNRNRSFRKLVKSTGELLSQLGHVIPGEWPPAKWFDTECPKNHDKT